MKTLTAFFVLLFPRSKKNSSAVNLDHASITTGCSTGTVNNHLIHVNDPDKSGSFLFFEHTVTDGQHSIDNSRQPMDNEQRLKDKEDPDSYWEQKVNDELAQRNIPQPAYRNWRERANDDLAACTAVDDPLFPPLNSSYKRKNENINVDHIFTINSVATTNNNKTRTNKNDAFLPFASFCLFKKLFQKIFTGATSAPQPKPGLMQNFRQPQYRPIPIISNHSNMKKFLRKTGLFSIALISILLVAAMSANATNYFTGSSGDPTNVNIWWTNTNGTGSHPANFTTAGDVFTIQNGHTLTNNATSWVVTGSVIIQSGGILSLTAANGTHSVGALTIDAGGSAIINRQFTVNGATSISGSISFASTSTTARPMAFGGDVTLNSGAVWTEATNGSNGDNNTYSFAGNFTNNATTFTATNNAAAIHTFTGAAKTISGATATSIPFVTISGSYTNSGTLTVANTLTINGGASLSNNGTATVTTALSGTGSFTNGATGTLNIGGTSGITTLTATASGNTVNYTGAAQTIKVTAYYKLGLSGSGNKTFAAGITMSNNLSISGTAVAALGTNNFSVLTLTIGGVGQPAGTYGSTASTATFKPSAFGTTGTGILTVTQQSCTPPTINGTLSTCGGLTTQLTSPDAPAASNPWVSATTSVATISNTGLVTGVSAGTSVITFTNSTGCTNTAIVTVNATPTTSFTKNDVTCFNTNTGQIVITGSGGTAPYTYSIDNGVNYSSPVPTGTFNNLGAGSYKIRVKDSNGCQSKPVQ